MTNPLEFHIACPLCDYSNMITSPVPKYKEVVYQPCNQKEVKQDHNMKDQIKCESCHIRFDFYWCAGHLVNKNDTLLKTQNNES